MSLDEELIELRREIHRRPELAGEERETAGLVAEQLRAAGLEVTTGVGGHGVVAVLDGSANGPTVAYRADMDAVDATRDVLPFPLSGRVHDEGFASRVPGVAHLCGHDLHTAIGVGVARKMAQCSEQVRGRLAFVFQPAEEPLQGARAMLDTGLVQRLAPREFYALHCSPFPTGAIAVSPGYGLPGLDQIRILLPGGEDAAAAVAAEVAELGTAGFPQNLAEYHSGFHALLDPEVAASNQESVSVATWIEPGPGGQPAAGVLLRVWPQERLPEVRAQVEQLAAAAGGHAEFQDVPFPALVNSAELSTAAGDYLSTAMGPQSVLWARASWPYNCEDFALFLDEAPGAQLYLGVADADSGINGAPHSPEFAADERAIGHGVRAMTGLLTHRLAARPPARRHRSRRSRTK
ncbi:M20/M25/M40 family metallo-hydrolase [Streptomyces sp. NBC_01275]|uniref:M20 metallopeptidase family protein n=1 Tax=Streptomyces sp. NBC_01275 TaxID=2903807 RepID=UPI0022587DA5|nr:M20/M25/M40 family metallo-hydrolase [Streptomyces sp. NBC_01275]MCX4768065.1 M20/M25/M40 family metallo-hydrolase [Streptomyces sp. NBC_01275]